MDELEARVLYWMNELEARVLYWFAFGEVGASSQTIAEEVLGRAFRGRDRLISFAPSDGGDFRRCVKFLRCVPEGYAAIERLAGKCATWATIHAKWRSLEIAMDEPDFESRSVR